MKIRRPLPGEKLAAGASLGLLLASLAGWWAGRSQEAMLRDLPAEVRLPGETFSAAALAAPASSIPVWTPPSARIAGAGGPPELFAPPSVFSDTVTPSWRMPSAETGRGNESSSRFELLEVRPAPYRLQLAGYVGAPGAYQAVLVSPHLPGTWLAREGWHHAPLGLTLKNFTVGRISRSGAGGEPTVDVVATALVEDEVSGELVTLDNRRRKLTNTPLAVLRLAGPPARSLELREGDRFTDARTLYHVGRVRLDPPEVVLVEAAPDLTRLPAQVLRLVPPGSRRASSPPEKHSENTSPAHPAAGLAPAEPRL
jgi:hypothetical protein